MALPVVTPKDLHIVRLSPKLRKILHERARRANQRAYAPVLAADRGELGAVNRTFRKEAASARGATSTVEGALSHALAGLQGSGLKGGYKKQVINEITSRQADNASALPFLLADAREARSEGLTKARQNLIQDRTQMLQGTAEDWNQLLKETRGAGAALEKERAGRRRSEKEAAKPDVSGREEFKLEVSTGLDEVNRLIKAYPGEEPSTPSEWDAFVGQVAKSEGVGLRAAKAAVEVFLHEQQRLEHEGRLPQPGVPGVGRGL